MDYRRTHPDSIGKENGYGTPAEAHLSEKSKKGLTKGLRSNKIKVAMINERRKGWEKNQSLQDKF